MPETFLRQCIESCINQTLKEIDIILVDDGSPDDCGKISERGREVMKAAMADLRVVSVEPDKLTAGVREMYYSVPMNPKRPQFYEDFRNMDAEASLQNGFQ